MGRGRLRSTTTMTMDNIGWLVLCCSGWRYLLAATGAASAAETPPPRRNRRPAAPGGGGSIIGREALRDLIKISSQPHAANAEGAAVLSARATTATTATAVEGPASNDDLSFLLDAATRGLVTSSSRGLMSSAPSSCPATCDSDLCSCIDRHGEPAYCAPQIQGVCASDAVPSCVPPRFVNYFESFFCPYADCVMGGKSIASCSCEFYDRYCETYGDANDVGYCDVAECCEEHDNDAGRHVCLAEGKVDSQEMVLASSQVASDPTGVPTLRPTLPPTTADEEEEEGLDYFEAVASELTGSMPGMNENTLEMSVPMIGATIDLVPATASNDDPEEGFDSAEDDPPPARSPSLSSVDLEWSAPLDLNDMSMTMVDELTGMSTPANVGIAPTPTEPAQPRDDEPAASLVASLDLNGMSMAMVDELSGTTSPSKTPTVTVPATPPGGEPSASPSEQQLDFNVMSMATTIDAATASPIKSPTTPKPTFRHNDIAGAPSLSPEESFDWANDSPSRTPSLSAQLEAEGMSMGLVESMNSMSVRTIEDEMSAGTKIDRVATSSPSESPTRGQTTTPSGSPTRDPTPKPTLKLTRRPTLAPAVAPLLTPSSASTSAPSRISNPTFSPTSFTPWPSYSPTNGPSDDPTASPTASPVAVPIGQNIHGFTTTQPTSKAGKTARPMTGQPTTERPTRAPSRTPSGVPSVRPTNAPTGSPSEARVEDAATLLPVERPTTENPTQRPTEILTGAPTSNRAVDLPVELSMTEAHTPKPTKVSTTKAPTIAPTRAPRKAPTKAPTTQKPTKLPTTKAPTTKAPTSVAPIEQLTEEPKSPTQAPAKTAETITKFVTPSSSPSNSSPPSAPTAIVVETETQLGLANVSSIMDPAAIGVFEDSCDAFLEGTWAEATPPIYDVECSVTGQRLLMIGRRRAGEGSVAGRDSWTVVAPPPRGGVLRRGGKRGLQAVGEPSLLVDVDVKGKVDHVASIFDQLVYGTFAVQSPAFVKQLKQDGRVAGIDDFKDLSKVYSIKQVGDKPGDEDDNSNGVQNPIDGSRDLDGSGGSSGEQDEKTRNGVIAAIVLCSMAVLGLFAAAFYHAGRGRRSNREEYSVAEASDGDASDVIDAYEGSLYGLAHIQSEEQPPGRPPHLVGAEDVFPNVPGGDPGENDDGGINGGSGESRNDTLTFMYSLEDALASPHSNLSATEGDAAHSPTSLADQMQHQITSWIDGEPISRRNRIPVDVVAPPGKLGIIIDTCSEGPIVHSVKPASPLEGLMFKGDLVVAVDDEDTREWSAHYLTKLVAKKSKQERKFTVLRVDRGGGGNKNAEVSSSIVSTILNSGVSNEGSDDGGESPIGGDLPALS